jgi:hypothetical protein
VFCPLSLAGRRLEELIDTLEGTVMEVGEEVKKQSLG